MNNFWWETIIFELIWTKKTYKTRVISLDWTKRESNSMSFRARPPWMEEVQKLQEQISASRGISPKFWLRHFELVEKSYKIFEKLVGTAG